MLNAIEIYICKLTSVKGDISIFMGQFKYISSTTSSTMNVLRLNIYGIVKMGAF